MALATGTKLGTYEVTGAIGAGGMGEVYKAHDTKLGRDVAIKVLPEAFAHDPERLARFQREAKMLAALNHPNIATIYGLEFSNGTHFLIMELVSGETLAERIKREGAVPIKEALKIAVQIAQALETANDKGIIHRDLKPANVKVTPEGNLKVLDFGLAKAFAGDNGLDLSNAPTLTAIGTEEGKLVGTPAYMSPEQARGQAVDKRTDIWAFGCLLYELLTARRAFRGETLTNTIAAILEREPDWQDLPRSTPTQIRDLLRRCLQKDRQRRMRDIGDVRVEIEEASFALVRGQQSVARTFHIPRGGTLAWGVLLVLVIATSVAVWNRKSSSPIFTRRGLKPIESLAVLPLEELSGDPEQDYFADGMTDELITDLAQIKALRVISRTSVMVYKGAHKSLPDIARELNVDAVLEGTVLRSGTRVRITAQLIYAPTDRHLWAESYEREVRDVLGLQREVAKAVVEEIRVNVTPEENMRLLGAPPVNSEAYEAYLRGRYLWNKRTPDDLKDAIVKFKRAIDLDPTYALAWAGLADGYSLLSDYDEEPPREAMPLARAAANKALDLDDSLGEPHATLATIEWTHDWNAAAAEIDFKRAIALRPNYASAHQWYGMYLCNRGRFDDGIVELRRAQELDPLSMVIEANVGRCHYYARRYNEASELLGPLARREPDYWIVHAILGQTYLAMGKLDDAIHELERARALLPDSSRNLGVLGDAYGRAGRRADALKLARELAGLSQERYVPPVYRAMIDIGLGERSQAIAFLERAYTDRSNWMVLLENEPEFDSLRSDPRFGALLYRIAHAPEQAVQPLGSGPRVADGADRRASLLDIPGEQE